MQKETKQLIFQERKHRKERKGNGRERRGHSYLCVHPPS